MSVPIPEQLAHRLLGAQQVLITSHRNPDGDALGSSLALQQILTAQNIASTVWLRDPVPANLSTLPGCERVHSGERPPKTSFDLAVVLECPTPDRTGIEDFLAQLPMINIDHHLGNSEYGIENWIDPSAPSVGCLVFRLASSLSHPAGEDAWNLLLVTLYTDTGGFRYANASEQAFSVAGSLVEMGANPEMVSGWIYENRTASSVRLLARALETLQIHQQGRLATLLVAQTMLDGSAPGDTDGIVDHARSIAGVEAAALLKEVDGVGIKVSLRSKGRISVEPVARAQGGGGHDKAAGFELATQDIEGARRQVVELLKKTLEGSS